MWVEATPLTVEGDGPPFPCPSYQDPELYGPDGLPTFRPLIIAHRGASGWGFSLIAKTDCLLV